MRTTATVALGLLLLGACSTPPSTPPESPSEPAKDEQPAVDVESEERRGLTAAQCEAEGGTVVGDIGDGAIHRPDYRCPDSGEAPIGTIVAEPSGAVAVEGAVCCK